jgi:xanthine dehydrogenase YagS FAD-binding subunit
MHPFEYAAPATIDEAVKLLGSVWGETEVYAGGTDLVTCMKQGLTAPRRVVSLRNIAALHEIATTNGELRIGAAATLAALAAKLKEMDRFPALFTAIENMASPQMTNVGTVGGDLCQRPRCWYYRTGHGLFGMEDGVDLVAQGDNRYHAIFGNSGPAKFVSASSLGPALIALGATMTVVGPQGTRELPAAAFFRTPQSENERETALAPNEILTLITVKDKGLSNATYEVRHRHGLDWPYVTASVAFGNGEAEVVLGHVAPTPWRAQKAAALLEGMVTTQSAAKAAAAAAEGATPLSQNAYKVAMVKTAVQRAILAAAGIVGVET